MVVGGLVTQPPTQASAVIVVLGILSVWLGTVADPLADRVAKFSGFGVDVETRTVDGSRELPDRQVVVTRNVPGDGRRDTARYIVGSEALERLLAAPQGHLEGCEVQVLLYDAGEEKLLPAYQPVDGSGESPGWKIGHGVSGVAFETKRYQRAVGAKVLDARWGLDAEMERRCAGLTAMAAAPLTDVDGEVVGTLSLWSRSPNPQMATPYGYQEHLDLADKVSVCIVELMQGRE